MSESDRLPWLPDPSEPREQLNALLARWSERYTDRDVHQVDQYDGWIEVEPGDMLITPDEDGDCVISGGARTISSSMGPDGGLSVRVHILTGTPPAAAARVLRKMADSVGTRWPDDPDGPWAVGPYGGAGEEPPF